MKLSQSNFNFQLPDCYLVRSYLIATVFVDTMTVDCETLTNISGSCKWKKKKKINATSIKSWPNCEISRECAYVFTSVTPPTKIVSLPFEFGKISK